MKLGIGIGLLLVSSMAIADCRRPRVDQRFGYCVCEDGSQTIFQGACQRTRREQGRSLYRWYGDDCYRVSDRNIPYDVQITRRGEKCGPR